MEKYVIKKYSVSCYKEWNEFVANSKNGTFLFHRDFMEYHNDRFDDYSLLIFKGQNLVAVLPANKKDNHLFSHQGLTYGGLILQASIGVTKVESIFISIIEFLKVNGFTQLHLKSIPIFYQKEPCFELEPLLNRLNAKLYCREQNLAIDYLLPLDIHKTKLKHFNKNRNLGFQIKKSTNFSLFWNDVLIPRLKEKHNAKPVHSLDEVQLLANKFPNNIEQHEIWLEDELLAGITIFKTDSVVKSQYGAITRLGEKYRALDFLFISLIRKFKEEGYQYFDMGTTVGNMSLLKQKEELGCRQYLQDFYTLQL